ncbi:hypothetical protein J1N35_014501 [Gossypium stocksii]|uniref:Uncharacterized protein n=1 Tax=Gossypium stocksii TaxID=47602 RepID=A0A9D4A8Z7_9ROSI|nr:hypothetical protein J1N35_014501 [Gossypium stocksii]
MEYEMNGAAVALTMYVSISSPMAPFPPFPDLNFVEQQVALVGKRVITTFYERIEGLESFERNQVYIYFFGSGGR